MWLADRLDVPVKRSLSNGPGLTAVRMATDTGRIVLDRADGSLATLSIQGQPDRAVALKRRETAELIAEELRRLDPDDTYASALRFGVERLNETLDGVVSFDEAADAVLEPPSKSDEPSAGSGESSPKGEPVEAAAEASAPEAEAEAPVSGAEKKATAK
jgi:hypothetical protein